MLYRDNPEFECRITAEVAGVKYSVYTPKNVADGYSTQRWVAAEEQNIYASAGANHEVMQAIARAGIEVCEDGAKGKVRTDCAALFNNILYRTKHPIDQHCGIRMGAILSMMEYEEDGKTYSEPVDEIRMFWRDKKEALARHSEEMYSFFLSWGISNTAAYREHLHTLEDPEYLRKREETLLAIMSGVSLPV